MTFGVHATLRIAGAFHPIPPAPFPSELRKGELAMAGFRVE